MFTTDLFITANIPRNSRMPIKRRLDKQWYIYTVDTIQQERFNICIDEF